MSRARRLRRFVVTVLGVTALIQIPTILVVSGLLARTGLPRPGLWVSLACALLTAQFFARFRPGSGDRPRSGMRRHVLDLPFFVHWCSSFLFAPLSIAVAIVSIGTGLATGRGAGVPAGVLPATWALCVALSVYAVYVRRRHAVVRHVTVEVAGLPRELDGFRIVQLSDLHVGSLTPASWLDGWVERANSLEADLVAVTGDLLSSGDAFIGATAEALGKLRAREGVVVSMGNHDYFTDAERLVAALRGRGLEVLRNAGRLIVRGEAGLWLAGVDDTWQRRDDIDSALAPRPAGVPSVLLAHDPKLWPEAVEREVSLTLSGHTHGAQLGLPWANRLWNLAMIGEPFSLGLYRRGGSSLYVHAGLGTTGPPARLGVAPEIAHLTLRRTE